MIFEPITYNDNETIPASTSDLTDAIDVKGINKASLTLVKDSTDGNPIISIYGSNDGVNFENVYLDDVGNPDTLELSDDSNGADLSGFYFRYFAVNLDPNGTTTGTLSIQLGYTNGI